MPNMLSAAQMAEFNDKGFTYARGLFAPDEVDLLTRAMAEDPAVRGSILDGALMIRTLEEHEVTGVIHVAGFKYAGVAYAESETAMLAVFQGGPGSVNNHSLDAASRN